MRWPRNDPLDTDVEDGTILGSEDTIGSEDTLEGLYARPFCLARPMRQSVPFVFAIPHSGRCYPAEFVRASRLTPLTLRRSEDAFVDSLVVETALTLGAPVIAARFPRAYVDVNRAPGELDPGMFAGPLPLRVDAPGPRVQAGLGVIPKVVRDGTDIYRSKLAADDAGERLQRLYQPYHQALHALLEETRASFGTAVVLDCHSMPSPAASSDIVLGDRYGAAAARMLLTKAEDALELAGFSVARNVPYAGGFTTQLYGHPDEGLHTLQIEINRGLYLDERTVRPGPHFAAVRERLSCALAEFLARPWAMLLQQPLPRPSLAAE